MRFLKLIFNLFLMIISLLIPTSKQYVVVGGWYGKRYADNSKGAFIYLNDNKERLGIKRVFWFTKNPEIYERLKREGLDVLYGMNFRSIFWHLRSGVHIIDQNPHDILGFLSVRRIRINLWHGIGVKSIGKSPILGKSSFCRLIIKLSSGGFWIDQYAAAPSEKGAEILSDGLGVPIDRFLIMTYPRTIPLYRYKKKFNDSEFKIYYLPTFRDKNEKCPLLDLDLKEVNEKFSTFDIQFYVKPHFASAADWSIIHDLSNFHIIDSEKDVYEDLGKMDLLITDYSSVYTDFMLMEKPILFFCYDIDYYQNEERNFLIPYDEYTPGDKIRTAEELLASIIWIRNNLEDYIGKYASMYKKINDELNTFNEKPNLEAFDKIWIS